MTHVLNETLPDSTMAAARARVLLSQAMVIWGSAADHDTARLLASELVTNALEYAGSPVAIRAYPIGGGLRVEVADESAWTYPVPRGHHEPAERGRGLELVDAMSARWGWRPQGEGKVVWFELDAPADVARPVPSESVTRPARPTQPRVSMAVAPGARPGTTVSSHRSHISLPDVVETARPPAAE
jgi:anti-sigma regulatory factor (Ser/Thr protein kinase)